MENLSDRALRLKHKAGKISGENESFDVRNDSCKKQFRNKITIWKAIVKIKDGMINALRNVCIYLNARSTLF